MVPLHFKHPVLQGSHSPALLKYSSEQEISNPLQASNPSGQGSQWVVTSLNPNLH